MLEARLAEGIILKKIVEAIKDLVTDVNIDCSPTGLSLQAMDSSHVALVALSLSSEGFEKFRCDKTMTLGLNIGNLSKVMKLGENDDTIILKAD
jgi:proliferating cell nuclear antigen